MNRSLSTRVRLKSARDLIAETKTAYATLKSDDDFTMFLYAVDYAQRRAERDYAEWLLIEMR